MRTVSSLLLRRVRLFTSPEKYISRTSLHINGTPLLVLPEQKFLGVTLDNELTLGPSTKAVKLKYWQKLNILNVLSHRTWDPDRACLLRIYWTVVRSTQEYESLVCSPAKPFTLNTLGPIYHQQIPL